MQNKKPPEYEVGYRQPPKHTRFQRDSSGNPKGRECRRSFGARLQLAAPCAGGLQDRRDPIHGHTGVLDRGDDRGFIRQKLLSGCGYGPLDLGGGQAPAVVDPVGGANSQSPRDVVAIAALALARMARGQARAGGVEQLAGQWAGLDLHGSQSAAPRILVQTLLHLIP